MADIIHFDIATSVTDSLLEIFDMMFSMDLQLSDDQTQQVTEGERIVGSVSVAGKVAGSINIEVSKDFSREMAAAMRDVELNEIEGDADAEDVIREICNMVGRNLKSAFCDAGLMCEVSSPSFTIENDLKIESLNTVRHERYVFSCNEHIIAVEVVLKVVDLAEMEEGDPVGTKPGNRISQEDINALLENENLLEDPARVAMDNVSYRNNDGNDITSGDAVLNDQEKLNFILDIPLDVVVELGRNKIKINELYNMGPGSVVEFMNLAGEPLDILVNGTLIAKGEVMVQGEKYCIRIVDVLSRTKNRDHALGEKTAGFKGSRVRGFK